MQQRRIEMRKQVDYVFRQLRYSAVDPTATTQANSEWVRDNYLSKGYEVIGSEVVRVDANDVYVGLHFALYEFSPEGEVVVDNSAFDVSLEGSIGQVVTPAKRGPKKKVAEKY
jgi:hypothetical protein